MKFLLSTVLLLQFLVASATNKLIVKANVLRGESFVTANVNPIDVETLFISNAKNKGYEVIEKVGSDSDILFVDFFIFQYPADYPTVTITIRSKKGIHFIDKERVKLFGDRKTANLNLVSKLMERFPASIDTNIFYEPTFEDILSNRRISLIGLTSNAVTSLYRPNFSSLLDWNNNTPVSFILPNDFDKYFAYCSNFQGIRKQLKESSIKIKLKINQFARLEIVDFETSIQLTDKQTDRLKEIVSQIPLWTVDKEFEGIFINLGSVNL